MSKDAPAYRVAIGVTAHIDSLVMEAKAGSDAAFGQLCLLYRTRVLRTLHAMTRRQEDAEDALQNAFLSAYLALGTFEGRSSFGSWFTRIAMNSALQQLRKQNRRAEQPLLRFADDSEAILACDPVDPAPDPEEATRNHQLKSQLQDAISRLPENLRRVLELHLDEDLSRSEIAARLAISEAAAKSRLYRAKSRLTNAAAKKRSSSTADTSPGFRIS